MAESYHDKIDRVRKPRVHITYKAWKGDAEVERELPFVVGVVGDFSGDPTKKLQPLEQRKFTQVSRDNFDDVLKNMTPGLDLKVENTLEGDGSELAVQLKFEKMSDFDPAAVAEQVPALAKLMRTREKLKSLLARADRSPELEGLLEQVMQNDKDALEKLKGELGGGDGDAGAGSGNADAEKADAESGGDGGGGDSGDSGEGH